MLGVLHRIAGRVARLLRGEAGNVSPILTLALVPIVGMLGLAGEVGGWYYTQRSMQNAADAAALAAAVNGTGTYAGEAAATAAQYGFTNGVSNTTVAATTVTCPTGTSATTCYQVAITRNVAIRMARLVGFNGNVALGGGRGQTVRSVAIASSRVNAGYCIGALANNVAGTSANAFTINGGASFNLGGCDIFSNADFKCNGSGPWGISAAYAVGPSGPGPCGTTNSYSQAPITDPFASKSNATNIPAPSGCNVGGNAPSTIAVPSTGRCYTSNLNVTGTTTVTTPAGGGVITFYNGASLTLGSSAANFTASTSNPLTLVFSGTAGANPPGFISGSNGTVDFGAPTSGTWSGVAIYQDHRMTGASSPTYSGSSPTFNITGLVYAPYANLSMRGAINHQTGGLSCLAVMANTLTVSGSGSIFANATSQCYQAGLTLPNGPTLLSRQALVQ